VNNKVSYNDAVRRRHMDLHNDKKKEKKEKEKKVEIWI
jgi:hypothetical protein